jgi:hypothetical protein
MHTHTRACTHKPTGGIMKLQFFILGRDFKLFPHPNFLIQISKTETYQCHWRIHRREASVAALTGTYRLGH